MLCKGKGKGHPATCRGGPWGSGWIKVPDFLDVRHYKGDRSSPYAPAAFTPGEVPGTHFQGLSRPEGTWQATEKKSPVTLPGIDPGTVRLVAQCLNHYASLGLNPII